MTSFLRHITALPADAVVDGIAGLCDGDVRAYLFRQGPESSTFLFADDTRRELTAVRFEYCPGDNAPGRTVCGIANMAADAMARMVSESAVRDRFDTVESAVVVENGDGTEGTIAMTDIQGDKAADKTAWLAERFGALATRFV